MSRRRPPRETSIHVGALRYFADLRDGTCGDAMAGTDIHNLVSRVGRDVRIIPTMKELD